MGASFPTITSLKGTRLPFSYILHYSFLFRCSDIGQRNKKNPAGAVNGEFITRLMQVGALYFISVVLLIPLR